MIFFSFEMWVRTRISIITINNTQGKINTGGRSHKLNIERTNKHMKITKTRLTGQGQGDWKQARQKLEQETENKNKTEVLNTHKTKLGKSESKISQRQTAQCGL